VTLARLLAEQAARTPGRPALATAEGTITYAALDARAAAAAGALRALGVRPGEPVAMTLPNTPASVAAFHGALRLGAVAVPLNPLLGAYETERRVVACGARLVEPEALAGPPLGEVDEPDGDETAAILYTSGSTGEPKRVELTHAGMRLSAEYIAGPGLGLQPDDVLFGSAPLAHVLGMTSCMNAAIAAGACVALVARFDAAAALETIEREHVTVFLGVPAMCTALLDASAQAGRAPRLRLAHVGGAPLDAGIRAAFESRFDAVVLEGYGMTEAGGAIALQHAGRPTKAGSVGTVAVGGELRAADDGELLFRGPTLMRGHQGWLATGDLGRVDEDGEVFLTDRKKDLILRGGYSVSPREVEDALLAHPGVRDAVAVGVPHDRLGEEIVALVAGDDALDPESLKAHARSRLAAYAYPRLVVVVDELPRGATGKTDRRAIDRATLAQLLD
jgi:long-chain acyl-CoA synthetase